jgi:hypothetical protein
LDNHPGVTTCLIQVKSVATGVTSVDMKLSVMARLAKAELPAFILIVRFKDNSPTAAHLIHVTGKWIEATLRRLRELGDDEKEAAHRKRLSITWSEDERLSELGGASLRRMVLDCTGTDPGDYTKSKLSFLKTCGFPERRIHGVVTFTAGSVEELEDQLTDFSIGKLNSLSGQVAEVSEVRFGIPKVIAQGTGEAVLTLPRLEPAFRTTLPVANASGTTRVDVDCDVFLSWLGPASSCERRKVRLTSTGFEMLLDVKGDNGTVSWSISLPPGNEEIALDDATKAARILLMLDQANKDPVSFGPTSESEPYRVGEVVVKRRRVLARHSRDYADNLCALADVVSRFGLPPGLHLRPDRFHSQQNQLHMLAACLDNQLKRLEVKTTLKTLDPIDGTQAAYLFFPGVAVPGHILVAAAAACGTIRVLGPDRPGWQSVALDSVRLVCAGKWAVPAAEWPKFNMGAKRRTASRKLKADLGISFVITPLPERSRK